MKYPQSKELFETLERQMTNAITDEMLDWIWQKQDEIMKLLDNGRPILETTYGERFIAMIAQRQKLFLKHHTYSEMATKLLDMTQ